MEKMTSEPDRFEIAALQTLSKASEIGSFIESVTIGPKSNCEETENCSEGDGSSVISTEWSVNQVDKEENPRLYAATALREMENIRRLNVADVVNERVLKLMSLDNELQSKMMENSKLAKEEMIIENKLDSKILENSIRDVDLVVSQKMYELIKRYADDKLKNEEKLAHEAKLREEEIKLRNERIQSLSRIEREFSAVHNQILDITANCKNRDKLISQFTSDFQKVQELAMNLNNVLQKVNQGNPNDQDVETCQIMLQCLSVIADKLKNNANLISIAEEELRLAEEELRLAEEELRLAEEQQAAQVRDNLSVTVSEVPEGGEAETSNISIECATENEMNLEKCICKELLVYCSELFERLDKFSKLVETYVSNAPSKKFLRSLKIAIGIPVNAVSSTDRSHMRDKFIKISQFLRGNFTLPDTPMSNLPKDSHFPFVVDYLCKNFISHAESRFTLAAPREAFLLASLALAIWSEFPDFGPILLANIMKKCPYVIPAYWPHYNDQSDEEYFLSLGYKYKNNQLEDERSFTNRMTGIFMFYVSIIVTPFRRNQPHIHGMENAWKWIAALLNLEPRSHLAVVTAELLYVFLEICGFKMSQCYGVQFRKIIQLLIDDYIIKLEKITPDDFRGPISRLKLYVVDNDVLRKGCKEPQELRCVDEWL